MWSGSRDEPVLLTEAHVRYLMDLWKLQSHVINDEWVRLRLREVRTLLNKGFVITMVWETGRMRFENNSGHTKWRY